MEPRAFRYALVEVLRSRDISTAVIDEIVSCVAARHAHEAVPRLTRKILSRHARRSGRPRKSLEYKRQIARAAIWAKFNGRSDRAIAQQAQQFGVLKTEIVRALSKRDPDITKLIDELEKSPGNFSGEFSIEPAAKPER